LGAAQRKEHANYTGISKWLLCNALSLGMAEVCLSY